MDHLYNVVWADDEIDTLLEDNKSQFARAGIEIIPFHDAASAIDYVRNNASFVDGIISDAKYPKAGEAFQEEGKSFPGLSLLMQNLSGLRKECKQPFPCWIYTGYGELLLDKYDNENDLSCFEGVMDKKADSDQTKEWIRAICARIAETKTEEFKLRQENPELFSLCIDDYLGKKMEKTLFDILAYRKDNETDPFNRFRDVLEEVMDLLVKDGHIGGNTQKTAINDRIDKFDKANRSKIPQYIIPSMKLLLSSSSLSHSDTLEKKEVEEGRAPFMYDTLLITLKTVLVWIKSFIDNGRVLKASSISASNTAPSIKDNSPSVEIKQEDTVDLSLLDAKLMGTEVGTLRVKNWSLQIGNEFVNIDRSMIERSWNSGLKLRVRIGKNFKGEPKVIEVVRVEQ